MAEWPAVTSERGAFTILDTGEELRFQFNPPEFSEALSANYARHQVPGLSHEVMNYINTSNNKISLSIYMSSVYDWIRLHSLKMGTGALGTAIGAVEDVDAAGFNLTDAKNFIQSLLYPSKSPSGGWSAPAEILFVWPKVIRMVCVVTELTFNHQRFSAEDLRTIAMTADVTIEEIVPSQRFSDYVRLKGSFVSGRRRYRSQLR